MAIVKRPPETIIRSLRLEQPVSELLDDYARFVGCSAHYVANFALRKTLARDPDYKRWKAGLGVDRTGSQPGQPAGE